MLLVLVLVPVAWAATPVTLRFSGAVPGNALPGGWKAYAMSRHRPMAPMAIVRDGTDSVFRIDADHAAGAIAHALDLPAATTLNWRWKVDHSVAAADMSKKKGDDFAARVYVFFDVPLSSLLRGTTLRQFTERVLNLLETRARLREEPAKLVAAAPLNRIRPARISTLSLGDLIIAAPSPSEARHLWREAFDERAYAPPVLLYEKGSTIIDVGANVGIFSRFALAETGGCRIVAIEPAAELFECLKRNLAVDSQVASLQLGCGARDAEAATFWYFPQVPAMSSFEPDAVKDRALLGELFASDPVWAAAGDNVQQALFLESAFTAQEQSCVVRRLSTLIRQMDLAQIDLLKIDVQRGEAAVLAGIDAEHWDRIHQVVVELQDADGAAARTKALLESQGFDVDIATIPLHRGTDVRFVYAIRS